MCKKILRIWILWEFFYILGVKQYYTQFILFLLFLPDFYKFFCLIYRFVLTVFFVFDFPFTLGKNVNHKKINRDFGQNYACFLSELAIAIYRM